MHVQDCRHVSQSHGPKVPWPVAKKGLLAVHNAGGKKFIQLNSSLEYGVLTITMDNSFDGQARQEDGKFLSSKRAGVPGVGLSSIRAVAKAHQGDARFEADGQVFRSSVYAKL